MRRWFVPHNYLQLCLQLLLGVAVYGAGLLWAFRTGRAWNVGELSLNNSSTELPIEIVEGD
jgi:hypothetical protein